MTSRGTRASSGENQARNASASPMSCPAEVTDTVVSASDPSVGYVRCPSISTIGLPPLVDSTSWVGPGRMVT